MVSSLALVACGYASFLSTSSAMVSANIKQNETTKRRVFAHKGAQTNVVIKFLSVLTKHTGANCNQLVEPTKDWRSDCLAKRNLVSVELCGVSERLHSMEGLAQSNNNAKLNYSGKHHQTLLMTSLENNEGARGGRRGRTDGGWCSA
jgi:hypothetical protein